MTQLPAHLQNRQSRRQVAQETRVGLGSAAVPSVSIMGSAFTLVDANGEKKPIPTNYLDCVIVDANPAGVQRVFWGLDAGGQPKSFDDSGLPPLCFSDNGVGASVSATEPQSASCASCPMKQFNWPSKIDPTKRTSACRPIKKVAVIAYLNGQGGPDGVYHGQQAAEFPFLLRVPVSSHDNLKIYSSKFNNQPFDVSDVVTRVSFVHGAVGQMDFVAVGYIDPDTDAAIEAVLEAKMTDNLVGRNDKPIQGQLPAPSAREIGTAAVQQELAKPAPPQPPSAPWQGPLDRAGPAVVSQPFVSPPTPAPAAKAGRGRPKKPPPAEQAPTGAPFAAPQQPAQQPVAPFAQPNPQPNHGIVSNAPAPSADMEKTLDQIFNLPS